MKVHTKKWTPSPSAKTSSNTEKKLCKTVTLKRPLIGFQDQLSLNVGQKYCRMLSAILLTFIRLPFVIKNFVLTIFEWAFYIAFTVDK